MNTKFFPVIDLAATGNNIRRLRIERGLTVRDIQSYFGFEEPRAVYKWQNGESLPTVDNLYALGNLLGVPMDQILVPIKNIKKLQRAAGRCLLLESFLCPAVPDASEVRCGIINFAARRKNISRMPANEAGASMPKAAKNKDIGRGVSGI